MESNIATITTINLESFIFENDSRQWIIKPLEIMDFEYSQLELWIAEDGTNTTANKSVLRRHRKTPTKSYRPSPSSKIHIKDPAKPFCCPQPNCFYQTKEMRHLDRHLDRHARGTSCPYFGCKTTFSTRMQFKKHLESHEGVQMYKCLYSAEGCNHSCYSLDAIIRHLKLHSEQ